MNKKSVISASAAVLLLISAVAVWYLWPREAREVKQVREIASKMFDESTTEEQRSEMRDQLRQISEGIPEEQRREVFREMGNQFRERMEAHIVEFSTLSGQERIAFLDRDIDRMESMRKEFERRRAEREAAGDSGRAGPNGGRPDGGRGGPGGPPGAGGPRRPGRGEMTQEQREERRRARLDNTTPEQRAYFSEYMKAVAQRREERGLPPMPPGRFGRGGPR